MKKNFTVVCNFKMNLIKRANYSRAIKKVNCENLILCPNFCDIANYSKLTKKYNLKIGAQNVCAEKNGAFTGEVSAEILKFAGAEFCIVGHSERKKRFFETMSQANKKIKQLIEQNITPIVCVGEDIKKSTYDTEEQTKFANNFVKSELKSVLNGIDAKKVIVAYEPIWSIGTGDVPTTKHISSVCHGIKEACKPKAVLYGGSVGVSNINQIYGIKSVDGVLVGGESKNPKNIAKMLEIINQ